MIQQNTVRQIVDEYVSAKDGYYVVEASVGKNNNILVEVDSLKGFSIDECEELTRFIEDRLSRDVEDYDLEVGSPGLTSPFKVLQQYYKFQGKEVEVMDAEGKKHNGTLRDVTDNGFSVEETVKIKPEGSKKKIEVSQKTDFSYDNIKYTKYTIKFE